MKTVKEIVKEYLVKKGYGGLYDEDNCGCEIEDLMPCGQVSENYCTAGYKVDGCTCGEGCDFHIVPIDDKAHLDNSDATEIAEKIRKEEPPNIEKPMTDPEEIKKAESILIK